MSHYIPGLKDAVFRVGLLGAAFIAGSAMEPQIRTVVIDGAADFDGYKKMFCPDGVREIEMRTTDGHSRVEPCAP